MKKKPLTMSADSTFASQQKALRRQFSYSDDYPLATMIKELNTQVLSRVGTGTLSEQLDVLCRTAGIGGRGVRSGPEPPSPVCVS